jgi:hypothetical protein
MRSAWLRARLLSTALGRRGGTTHASPGPRRDPASAAVGARLRSSQRGRQAAATNTAMRPARLAPVQPALCPAPRSDCPGSCHPRARPAPRPTSPVRRHAGARRDAAVQHAGAELRIAPVPAERKAGSAQLVDVGAGAVALGLDLGPTGEDAQAAGSQFNGATVYLTPPAGTDNTFLTTGSTTVGSALTQGWASTRPWCAGWP